MQSAKHSCRYDSRRSFGCLPDQRHDAIELLMPEQRICVGNCRDLCCGLDI